MKENTPYLIWAYALVGLLITVYSVSLVRRSRRVANELKALAATLKSKRGQKRGQNGVGQNGVKSCIITLAVTRKSQN